jgi:hypothetical protein
MEREETVRRMHKAASITEEQVGLIGRLLDLEEDPGVHKVELFHNSGHNPGGYAVEIQVREPLPGREEFINYLQKNNFSSENLTVDTYSGEVNGFRQHGVRAYFLHPDCLRNS